jgi:hypothetical protein
MLHNELCPIKESCFFPKMIKDENNNTLFYFVKIDKDNKILFCSENFRILIKDVLYLNEIVNEKKLEKIKKSTNEDKIEHFLVKVKIGDKYHDMITIINKCSMNENHRDMVFINYKLLFKEVHDKNTLVNSISVLECRISDGLVLNCNSIFAKLLNMNKEDIIKKLKYEDYFVNLADIGLLINKLLKEKKIIANFESVIIQDKNPITVKINAEIIKKEDGEEYLNLILIPYKKESFLKNINTQFVSNFLYKIINTSLSEKNNEELYNFVSEVTRDFSEILGFSSSSLYYKIEGSFLLLSQVKNNIFMLPEKTENLNEKEMYSYPRLNSLGFINDTENVFYLNILDEEEIIAILKINFNDINFNDEEKKLMKSYRKFVLNFCRELQRREHLKLVKELSRKLDLVNKIQDEILNK